MLIEAPENVTKSGGLIISMDGRAPRNSLEYNETQEWILAAMSGFFAFMACIGCLLVCIQAGYLPGDSRFVPFTQANERSVLTEDQVGKLPVVQYGSTCNETACAICIEDYTLGEKLKQLPCGHTFHQDCLIPWLTERHASCPLCKYDVSAREEDETDENSNNSSSNNNTNTAAWFWSSYGSLARFLHHDRQLLLSEDEEEGESMEAATENR